MSSRLDDMVLEITDLLGGSVVNIELTEDSVKRFINIALRKITSHLDITNFIEVPAVPKQKLDDNIKDVIRVIKSPQYDSDFIDEFRVVTNNPSDLYKSISSTLSNQTLDNMISRGFKVIGRDLYLDNYYGTVTLEYIPVVCSIDDIVEEKDLDWVLRYSLALCKESLGRIRGKFKANNSPLEGDSDRLLEEASQEKQECEEELKDRGNGLFFVIR